MNFYKTYIDNIHSVLTVLQVTDNKGITSSAQEGFHLWCEHTKKLKEANKTMFIAGNGASAAMASHMSADASKNGGFRSLSFDNISLLTAISNDVSYEESFSMPLKRYANPGDMLVTISSSGNSPNIIKALHVAREMQLTTVTLSGMDENNHSRKMGTLNFFVPAATYGLVESSHQVLLHCWLDYYMEYFDLERKAND